MARRAEGLSGDRFVVFLQNHDQVGNRPRSDRLGPRLNCPAKLRLAASVLLLSPYLPLLFMGEEYGEENPFPFFCSFRGEELASAVRDGRRREFHAFDPAALVADPNAEATFESAPLSWSWPEGTARAGLRRLYRDLLAARREWPATRRLPEPIGPPHFSRRRRYRSQDGERDGPQRNCATILQSRGTAHGHSRRYPGADAVSI